MIEITNLTKRFGLKTAVNNVSFTVRDGEIIGFLGPNGAGKTTTMNIVTGYLSATSGSVKIDGLDILDDATAAKSHIGYLPEQVPLYLDMTVIEFLRFIYELRKVTLKRDAHLGEICDVTGISDSRDRVIRNLSKGYRQRVGIAAAIVGNPKTIIFDEPTVGLDPKQVVEIRSLIKNLGKDHSVILSTHILSEVQSVCDRIIIINKGKIVADERTENILNILDGSRKLEIKVCGPIERVISLIRGVTGVAHVENLGSRDSDSVSYYIESEKGLDIRKPLFRALAAAGYPIVGLESTGVSLEDVFLSVVAEKGEAKTKSRRKRGA